MTGRDAGKGRVNRDDAEGREDRDSMSREGRELFLDAEDPRNLWFGTGVLAGFPARFLVFLLLPPPGRRPWWRIQSGLGGWALGTAASKLVEVMALAATLADGLAGPRQ